MGIVNVTPDSFSDGGMYYRPKEAIRRAQNAIEEGAAIIDFGAESTRPDATPLTAADEIALTTCVGRIPKSFVRAYFN